MSDQAQALGVDIFPGTAGASVIYENDKVIGVSTGDTGVGRDGKPKENYQPGIDILAA